MTKQYFAILNIWCDRGAVVSVASSCKNDSSEFENLRDVKFRQHPMSWKLTRKRGTEYLVSKFCDDLVTLYTLLCTQNTVKVENCIHLRDTFYYLLNALNFFLVFFFILYYFLRFLKKIIEFKSTTYYDM